MEGAILASGKEPAWWAQDALGERESPVSVGLPTPDIPARITVPIFSYLITYLLTPQSRGLLE